MNCSNDTSRHPQHAATEPPLWPAKDRAQRDVASVRCGALKGCEENKKSSRSGAEVAEKLGKQRQFRLVSAASARLREVLSQPLSSCVLLLASFVSLHAAEPAGVVVDRDKKTVTIAAKVAPRKLPNLEQIYPIEVIACFAAPKGVKAHETVVTIEAAPSAVHQALESLGLKPGKPADNQNDKPAEGPELMVYLEFERETGGIKKVPVSQLLLDIKTGKPLGKAVKFRFTGSELVEKDPNKPGEKMYGADRSGTLVAVFPVTASTVLQSTMSFKDEKYVKLETDKKQLPKEGTVVKLILEAAK